MFDKGQFVEGRKRRVPISASVISGVAAYIDSVAILGSGAGVYFWLDRFGSDTLSLYIASVCAIWITIGMIFQFSELYRFEAIVRPIANIDSIVVAFATGFFFMVAAAFAFKVSESLSRLWLGTFAITAFSATLAARLLLANIVVRLARRGVFSRNVIIAGTRQHVERLVRRMERSRQAFVRFAAIFIDDISEPLIAGYPVAGTLDDIPNYVRTAAVDDVVIALPWSEEQQILELIDRLRELPVNVYLGSDLIGLRLDFNEPPGHFAGAPIHSVVGHPMPGWAVAIKAIEDYVLGVLILILLSIPMAIIAILIKLDSPGPALFRQDRLGFNNKKFSIYKFRSMRVAEAPEDVTVQATKDDPRVTRIGRFLRRSSLDELPQLLNVLNGTMSLVGPRPHAVDHNEHYAQHIRGYFGRHRVKPGVTGWAQVNGLRGQTETPEKMAERVRYDVYYTENWSLFLDLRILLQTFVIVFTGKNAH